MITTLVMGWVAVGTVEGKQLESEGTRLRQHAVLAVTKLFASASRQQWEPWWYFMDYGWLSLVMRLVIRAESRTTVPQHKNVYRYQH